MIVKMYNKKSAKECFSIPTKEEYKRIFHKKRIKNKCAKKI